ncbi:MAG: fibronectin type III domain-containing protein [Cyanobacteria bacterium MAG IRC4_bin_6]|nr:fibronectin type III domain-containing protein [Cyanobacteria bacterium MAG IRC4_bin_6]
MVSFNAGNWDSSQTVAGEGQDDDVDNTNDEHTATISHAASSTDLKYTITNAGSVTVTDDDAAALSKPTGFTATAGNGEVSLAWNNPSNSAITGWQVQQKAGNNAYGSWTTISNSGPATVSHTVSGLTNGTVYAFRIRTAAGTVNGTQSDEATATPLALVIDPLPPANVPVVSISGGPAITEGDNAVFTLTASPAPTDPITVNVTVAAGSGYSPDPAHGGATVVVADARLPEDLPPADLLLSPTGLSSSASLTVDRGGSSSYTIALAGPLSAGAVVTVSIRAEGSAITIEPAEVTFTAADWNLPQRVRVTASESGGGSSSLSHRATGGGYDNAEATLTVRVPAATAGVTLSSRSVSVSAAPGAGRTDTYTVVLDSQPTHNVTITVTSGLPAAVLVSGPGGAAGTSAILTFTPATWATPQQVTVTGVEDNLEQSSSRTVTITHRAASDDGDYDNISIAPVTVTVPVVAAADVAVQQGWLTRLGRTVSQQVVDALQQRFSAQPAPGVHLTVDGAAISSAVPLQENQQVLSKALGFERSSSQQVVEGSAFSFSPQATGEAGGTPRLALRLALWGRGALSSFHGQENTVSLDGEVSTTLVGAEWERETTVARWTAGAA